MFLRRIARHEILCTFDDVACQAAQVLKDRGEVFSGAQAVSAGGADGDFDEV